MWFWKKRKPEQTDEKSPTTYTDVPPLMGYVARPLPPRQPEPEPDDVADAPPENEDGEEGTSRAAQAVSAGTEPMHSPRPSSFDPSQVAASSLISLQSVQIATPCRADWSKMEGDDKSRFCQTCQKSVYNLSAMTTTEAQALIEEKQSSLCARIYRRADDTVITQDCSVGKTTPRRPFWGALAGLLAAIGCGGLLSGCGSDGTSTASVMQRADRLEKMRSVPVVGAIVNKFSPVSVMAGGMSEPVAPRATRTMGKIACPKPTATPKPKGDPAPTQVPSVPEMGDIGPEMGEAAPEMSKPAPPSSRSGS